MSQIQDLTQEKLLEAVSGDSWHLYLEMDSKLYRLTPQLARQALECPIALNDDGELCCEVEEES